LIVASPARSSWSPPSKPAGRKKFVDQTRPQLPAGLPAAQAAGELL